MDLDHFLSLFAPDKINQVQISIDGPKRVHDKRRVYIGDGGSFDVIVANVNRLLALNAALVQLRVHVDPANIGHFEEVIDIFESQGWLNNKNVVIYANTVYSKNASGEVGARLENTEIASHLTNLVRQYDNVFLSAAAVNARMLLLPALMSGDEYHVRSTYCAANTGQYIFAPDGYMYACWESVGKKASRIGSYMNGEGEEQLTFDTVAVANWFSRSSGRIAECLECPFALVCGGGCAQYAEYNTGSLYRPYCDDFDGVFRQTLTENVLEFSRRMSQIMKGEELEQGRLEENYG